MSNHSSVVVLAKEPLAGQVKTRLVPPLMPSEAAQFAAACLVDLAARLASFPTRRVLALPADSSRANVRRLIDPSWVVIDQGEGDLGQRLARVTAAEFAAKAARVIVLGSDHPNLPLPWLAAALEAANSGDVGWVPTLDGGYACLALPRNLPEIFADVPWSTDRVAEATRNNARRAGVNLKTFGPWYDLDTAADLDRFLEDPASAETCPATWRVLVTLEPPWAERRKGRD